MKTLAFVAALCGSVGFWAGQWRAAPPPAPTRVPVAPAETDVPKRLRAATFMLAAPWVHAGDHVDVLCTIADPVTNEQLTLTLLENIAVAGSSGDRLSVLVIPEEAELLQEAEELGALDVTLRDADDPSALDERGHATIATVLSSERKRVLESIIRGRRP